MADVTLTEIMKINTVNIINGQLASSLIPHSMDN